MSPPRPDSVLRSLWPSLSLMVLTSAVIGCGSKADLLLFQPGMTPPQDRVSLRSEWAYVADDEPGVERVVLAFPLPGARAGDRRFHVYLRTPGKQAGPAHIGDALPGGGRVCGFLIQAAGRLAGKTVFVKGQIELRGVAFDGGRRRGKISLQCADGSSVEGEFLALVAPLEVMDFEQAKAGDVRALLGTGDAPAESGLDLGPTTPGTQP